jgi:hypothetical protein
VSASAVAYSTSTPQPGGAMLTPSLLGLLRRFGSDGVALLFTAVLLERRVLFMGARGTSAGESRTGVFGRCSGRKVLRPLPRDGTGPQCATVKSCAAGVAPLPLIGGAGEVCNCVLAAALLVSPGVVDHDGPRAALARRLFPHASLSDTAFQDVPGYIAGVTNPIFESKRCVW